MLKFENWFIATWLIVGILYSFRWSSFNTALPVELILVFGAGMIIALVISIGYRAPKPERRVISMHRKPTITFLLVALFIADFAYRAEIPVLRPYTGYDVTLAIQEQVGIPVVHVIVISVALFYAMYLAFLWVSERRGSLLAEFGIMLLLFIFNNSRGYVLFSMLVLLLLLGAAEAHVIREFRVVTGIGMSVLGVASLIFVSIMGNIRSGFHWNDSSYITSLGRYDNYPTWLTEHFKWIYTYVTSPVANLKLNLQDGMHETNMAGFIYSFVPESFSKEVIAASYHIEYVVDYLNASTGYAGFAATMGYYGVFIAICVQLGYYALIRAILKKQGSIEVFGNAVLVFLVIVSCFYSPFYSSAVCYMPLWLIVCSTYHKRKQRRDERAEANSAAIISSSAHYR
ncbi:hypothetical protein [Schaalia hyovaginalis]|uniref:hypothetical protein n=1 Tax=Schaalia hyovaginalis TaxID=29316 RepID=UPI0026EAF752|nr:hypothetical protein [Schaalia hyovaginalis]MCI6556927.1 hypothetical protein [Schaalia hyovaginalis]MDD7554911.1 hypothetical protein [Schaalia hyovaginalis]MDY3093278.1 hypothetical protein [Schaalia hyovaginalis]